MICQINQVLIGSLFRKHKAKTEVLNNVLLFLAIVYRMVGFEKVERLAAVAGFLAMMLIGLMLYTYIDQGLSNLQAQEIAVVQEELQKVKFKQEASHELQTIF